MKSLTLKKFDELQKAVREERDEILKRIEAIDEALGVSGGHARSSGGPSGSAYVRRPGYRLNPMPLRSIVLDATKSGPLSTLEILSAVQKAGYVFRASNPVNSLKTFLYTSKDMKNYGRGIFGPA